MASRHKLHPMRVSACLQVVFKPIPEVWGYFSVKGGGGIHEFSDSQVGLSWLTWKRIVQSCCCCCCSAPSVAPHRCLVGCVVV